MSPSLSRLANSLPFAKVLRQLEQEMETVVKVIKPGPLGVVEHKFTAQEIYKARDTVSRAIQNWQKNASIERNSPIMKDFIEM
ncbi:hypothetical protein Leryth_022147 [Lithospermum erythrorhizon]|nr:hypothetical protein Leryth_022147 [Lithospermum erythrorhizon]